MKLCSICNGDPALSSENGSVFILVAKEGARECNTGTYKSTIFPLHGLRISSHSASIL